MKKKRAKQISYEMLSAMCDSKEIQKNEFVKCTNDIHIGRY